MFSLLRKGLIYKDISPDILEHDEDLDADQWTYDDKDVYRGSFDPRYTKDNLNVYWLYDDNLNRIGLAEHDADNAEDFKVLWFMDNPFATLYQDESWRSKNTSLWSMISNEAYQDCLEDDFVSIFDRCLSSKYRLVTPEFLMQPPTVYECSKCGKKSLKKLKNCSEVVESSYFNSSNVLFIDESFVVYERSKQLSSSYEQEQQEPQQQQVVQEELQDAQVETPQVE